jgi:thiosulfate reductase cytochrome b subunit
MVIETEKSQNNSLWLKKIARASSWLLLVSVMVLVLSGWGITQTSVIYKITGGLINRGIANSIHRAAVLPLSFFFLVHVLINIGLSIKSRHVWVKQVVGAVFLVIGAAILGIVVYMEYSRLGG